MFEIQEIIAVLGIWDHNVDHYDEAPYSPYSVCVCVSLACGPKPFPRGFELCRILKYPSPSTSVLHLRAIAKIMDQDRI